MHGSRVNVADITKRCRGIETRWDLVLELFREQLEIDQICQFQKCSPRWEEQSINRVFHSSMPGSRVIVGDIKKDVEEWKFAWDLVLKLFREPLEKDQICQFQKCSPRWEEQSINWVFHSSISRSRVIVADIKKDVEEWKPAGTLYLKYFENHKR